MNRRDFIKSASGLLVVAAPAIVHAANIMPIFVRKSLPTAIIPGDMYWDTLQRVLYVFSAEENCFKGWTAESLGNNRPEAIHIVHDSIIMPEHMLKVMSAKWDPYG